MGTYLCQVNLGPESPVGKREKRKIGEQSKQSRATGRENAGPFGLLCSPNFFPVSPCFSPFPYCSACKTTPQAILSKFEHFEGGGGGGGARIE